MRRNYQFKEPHYHAKLMCPRGQFSLPKRKLADLSTQTNNFHLFLLGFVTWSNVFGVV